ncbi:MAG: ComEA family DNA-binding protein [Pseudomonas sp.]
MLNARFSSLVFALLAGVSVAVSAAPAPTAEVTKPAMTTETAQVTQAAVVAKVNLNTADAAMLSQSLLGIGEVKAQAIVAYREASGPFASVDELLEVKGIGAATLEKNRDRLSIN